MSRVKFLAKFATLNFWQFLKIYFDFVLFWLGIWCQSFVWVIMGQWGVSQNVGILVVLVNMCSEITHWGRVTHICVSKLAIIGSDNGLSPDRRQAIIWTNAGLLLIGPLGTNFIEILIGIQTFSFKKMRLEVSSAKWRPSCLRLNVLRSLPHLPGASESILIFRFCHLVFKKRDLLCACYFDAHTNLCIL